MPQFPPSPTQLAVFRSLLFTSAEEEVQKSMVNNFRVQQPLCGRTIRSSFKPFLQGPQIAEGHKHQHWCRWTLHTDILSHTVVTHKHYCTHSVTQAVPRGPSFWDQVHLFKICIVEMVPVSVGKKHMTMFWTFFQISYTSCLVSLKSSMPFFPPLFKLMEFTWDM